MTDHTDRKDEVGTGEMLAFFEGLQHFTLTETSGTVGSPSGPIADAIRSRLLAHDSLLKERDELKQKCGEQEMLIADLTRDMNEYHDKAEKAEAEAKELREELGRSRGLREAAMAFRDCASINHWEPLVKAALAYRQAQEAKDKP